MVPAPPRGTTLACRTDHGTSATKVARSGPDHAGLDREVLRSLDRGLGLLRSLGAALIASGVAIVGDRTSSARGEVGREKYGDRALKAVLRGDPR